MNRWIKPILTQIIIDVDTVESPYSTICKHTYKRAAIACFILWILTNLIARSYALYQFHKGYMFVVADTRTGFRKKNQLIFDFFLMVIDRATDAVSLVMSPHYL